MGNVLITGCGGFIGSYLAELMLEKGHKVYGSVFASTENIEHISDKITILRTDMTDKEQIDAAIKQSVPDIIFHLAAQSFVLPSWKDIEGTLDINVLATIHLFEAVRKAGINPVIVFASSSAGYGLTREDEVPIKEDKEFRPSSPYAVSKISADMFFYIYWRAYGMKIIRARIFNTIGPRKKGNAISDFARMIIGAEDGGKITVGNLDPVLDFTDVRDTANALRILAEKGAHGDAYNVCSSKGRKISDVLDTMVSLSGKDISIEQDKSKFRPADDPIFVGDNTKLKGIGWQPVVSIEKSLKDTLDYWRNFA